MQPQTEGGQMFLGKTFYKRDDAAARPFICRASDDAINALVDMYHEAIL